MRIVRAAGFREGRWKNGLGVSWDIASDPPDAGMEDFGWRFAIARIDGDVPFSAYPGVDRVFTLIEGHGLRLSVAGQRRIDVDDLFVPVRFPGDAETHCKVNDGPCRALNLFVARGRWQADVAVASGHASVTGADVILVFALDGPLTCNAERLEQGGAAVAHGAVEIDSGSSRHYRAVLRAIG